MISKIERHSIRALPALETEYYDGWCLRFANGHTRRANSVNILEPGTLPLEQKIEHCEARYLQAGQPCHFRLTPLADPELDRMLEKRGYSLNDPTEVRISGGVQTATVIRPDRVKLDSQPTDTWLQALANLTRQSPTKRETFRQMIARTDLDTRFASVTAGTQIVSCGLGVMSEDFLGMFEFATHPDFRRQGIAGDIVKALFADAREKGVDTAYLQVVQSNKPGVRFWQDMGFEEVLYVYSYRSKSGP